MWFAQSPNGKTCEGVFFIFPSHTAFPPPLFILKNTLKWEEWSAFPPGNSLKEFLVTRPCLYFLSSNRGEQRNNQAHYFQASLHRQSFFWFSDTGLGSLPSYIIMECRFLSPTSMPLLSSAPKTD